MISALALVVGLLLLAGTAAGSAALMRIPSLSAFVVAVYVLALAEVVALTESLSLLGAVGRGGYLAGEAVLAVAVASLWLVRGRPSPPRLVPRGAPIPLDPRLAALTAAVGAGLVYGTLVALSTAPNNWDSMTYHLARVASWYQEQRVGFVDHAPTERINEMPPNAELLVLYTVSLLRLDRAAALPQLVAAAALAAAVFVAARRLSFRAAEALFAGLLTLTLSEIALQSLTTQNDLVVASLVVAAVAFLLGDRRVDVALAGLAIGLALGTKLTAAYALPGVALVALASLPRRRLVQLAAAAAIAFAAFGSFGYVRNAIETGNPLPAGPEIEQFSPEHSVVGTLATAGRIAYRFLDLSGYEDLVTDRVGLVVAVTALLTTLLALGRLGSGRWGRTRRDVVVAGSVLLSPVLVAAAAVAVRGGAEALDVSPNPRESTTTSFEFIANTRANEDYSFFGPLGAAVVVPVAFVALVRFVRTGARRRDAALAATLPLFVLEIALTYRYNTWLGRFFVVPVAVTMPLTARLYRIRGAAASAIAVGAVTLFAAHAFNELKPSGIDEARAAWQLTRGDAQALDRPEMAAVIEAVEATVPDDATLGAVLGVDDWSYPLFGPGLSRRVVFLPLDAPYRPAETAGIEWIAFAPGQGARGSVPGWHHEEIRPSGWRLARALRRGRTARRDGEARRPSS